MRETYKYNCGYPGCLNIPLKVEFNNEEGTVLLESEFGLIRHKVYDLVKEFIKLHKGNITPTFIYEGNSYPRFRNSLMGGFLSSGRDSKDLECILPKAGIGLIGELISTRQLSAHGGICVECNEVYCKDHLFLGRFHDSEGSWREIQCGISNGIQWESTGQNNAINHCLEYNPDPRKYKGLLE